MSRIKVKHYCFILDIFSNVLMLWHNVPVAVKNWACSLVIPSNKLVLINTVAQTYIYVWKNEWILIAGTIGLFFILCAWYGSIILIKCNFALLVIV